MLRALYSSSAGMQSQQLNLDVIANNLANVNTHGFKRSKIEFQDLLYQTTRTAGAESGGGNVLPTSMQVGHGSRVVSTSKVFTDGELFQTGEQLDVAIQGDGFFRVTLPDGTEGYTRDGSFKLSSAGNLVTNDGLPLVGAGQIPPGTTSITISPSGQVSAVGPGGEPTTFEIQIVRFPNPGGLDALGRNLYKLSPASGAPEIGTPGSNGFGELAQNYLEMSNVKVVEEMVKLIMAQRAYEVNSKAVQASDEMMQQSNNLRR